MELKEAILHQLNRGRENAVKGSLLAKRLGFKDDRTIRLTIREMIANGVPIASSTSTPAGYFISETLEESVDYMRDLKSRLVENAYRLRDFKRASREIVEPYQMVML